MHIHHAIIYYNGPDLAGSINSDCKFSDSTHTEPSTLQPIQYSTYKSADGNGF